MKTLNVMLSNLGGRVVPIGYEGENLYTRIRINCIEVFSEYPDATVSMVVSPPDGEMYPAVVEKSGVMVIWDITDSVLSSNGSGECQLTFTEGDVVRKSVVFGISINRSLVASGEAPEPVQEWIDRAEQTAQEIAENAAMLAKQDIVESYGEIAPAIIETASGEIASISDGADGMLVKKLTVDIDPVQEGSGDPSPDNVRPISGWDSANVSRTGKNLLNIDREVGTPSPSDVYASPRVMNTTNVYVGLRRDNYYYSGYATYSNENGIIKVTTKNNINYGVGFPIECEPNTSYTFSAVHTNGAFGVGYYDDKWNYIDCTTLYYSLPISFTTPNNAKYLTIVLGSSPINTEATISNVQLELGSTASTYEAYHGSAIEYAFPSSAGTVYGGSLTIHQDGTGELVVDRAKVVLDGSQSTSDYMSVEWQKKDNTTGIIFKTAVVPNIKTFVGSNISTMKCDRFPTKKYMDLFASDVIGVSPYTDVSTNYGLFIRINDTSVTSAQLANAYFESNPTTVVYELATPVTYQLTNQQVIALLKGSNNIWADTGDVAVEYPADTKLYIDGKVAELQALILENISNS